MQPPRNLRPRIGRLSSRRRPCPLRLMACLMTSSLLLAYDQPRPVGPMGLSGPMDEPLDEASPR